MTYIGDDENYKGTSAEVIQAVSAGDARVDPDFMFWVVSQFSVGQGFYDVNIRHDALNEFSKVFASITEYNSLTGQPFLGNANLEVLNLAPSRGLCRARVFNSYGAVLTVRINMLIIN